MAIVDRPPKKQQIRIVIDMTRCKKCDLCVNLCPRGVFALVDFIPVVVHEEKCTICEICELICPDFAINLEVISP